MTKALTTKRKDREMAYLKKLEEALALLDATLDEDRAVHATDEELDASTRKFNEATEIIRELVKQERRAVNVYKGIPTFGDKNNPLI